MYAIVNGIFSIIFRLLICMKYRKAIDFLATNLVTGPLTEFSRGF